MAGDVAGRDFLISFAEPNRAWAEWVAVELERAGYTTVVQTFDFRAGTDFVHRMQVAASTVGRTIAILSPAYLVSDFGEAEWRAAFVRDPTGDLGLLIPVRVQPCNPPGLLASRVYVDLVGVEDQIVARRKLLAAVDNDRSRPTKRPYPGANGAQGRFPGLGPPISNLPPRSVAFSGREDVLRQIYAAERAEPPPPALAVHGLGGVGKTELVREYAHRFASDYSLIWWINAEQTTSVWADLALLARRLGIGDGADQAETMTRLFDELRVRSGWLLIYDNATSPRDLAALLPTGGHLLITSRWPSWSPRAVTISLDVWSRQESIGFLRRRTNTTEDQEEVLAQVAELVGDFPLALEEAATFLDETGAGLNHYRDLLQQRAQELFGLAKSAEDDPADANRQRVATVWSLSLDQVRQQEPAAEDLLNLLAFLDPAVPRQLPVAVPSLLPDRLAAIAADPLAYDRLIRSLRRFSLIKATPSELRLHRMVQAVIRARLPVDQERIWAVTAIELLRHEFPAGGTATERERLLPQLFAVIDQAQRLDVAGADSAWLLVRAATYLREQGLYRQARSRAEQAGAILSALRNAAPTVVDRYAELGQLFLDLSDPIAAHAQYALALEAAGRAYGLSDPRVAARYEDLGRTSQAANDLAQATIDFTNALRVEPTPARHAALGRVLEVRGDYQGARAQWETAVAMSANGDPDALETAALRNGFGNVLLEMGDYTAAYEQIADALAISERALGPLDPEVAVLHNNLGGTLQYMGDYAGAREQFEIALSISRSLSDPNALDVGIRLNNLAAVLRAQGDLPSARTELEKALQLGTTELGPDHPVLASWNYNLGLVLRQMGKLKEGRDCFQVALLISSAALGPAHPQTRAIKDALDHTVPPDSESDDQ